MLKIGILTSGDFGFEVFSQMAPAYSIVFVLTDKKSTAVVNYCKLKDLPFFVGNPRGGTGYKFVKDFEIDVVISINYLFLIEDDIITHPNKLAFNIHGSLLPKYRGRTPHVWSIINNEKFTGITAHKIIRDCDAGDIIEQIKIPIEKEDTGADLLNRFKSNYLKLIEKITKNILAKNLNFVVQDESKATYFGKRIPDDGLINWAWSRERIYNWVRAQAHPYPGAFTYYRDEKIIIDKIEFNDFGFNYLQENGTILQVWPKLIVKAANGAIVVKNIRNQNINFILGEKFVDVYRK